MIIVKAKTLTDVDQNLRGFCRDCPDGKLDKLRVKEVYDEIYAEGDPQFFVDQIFRVLDGDNNGFIDFKVCARKFLILVS